MDEVVDTFGFELFRELYRDKFSKKEDVIILFVHWYLTKSGFRCVDVSDEKECNPSEKGSELLPQKWNLLQNYTLRYVKDKKVYVLIGMKSDADLLLNLVKYDDNSVANIQFPIEATVTTIHGTLETIIPTYQTILHTIKRDLVNPLCSGLTRNTNEATTQTAMSNTSSTSSTLDSNPIPSADYSRRPDLLHRNDPLRVGARDLDPLAHPDDGGMIFQPFRDRPRIIHPMMPALGIPGRLPPGAVPPGARFDPFGPPDLDIVRPRPAGLGNDHLPPPGYDDMFQ